MADDPRVTKRRVTMTTEITGPDGTTVIHQAVDYVRPDFLDAYLADASSRWSTVEVSEEPDAGPGGYDGATIVPDHLDTPLAGQVFPATEE